MASSLSKSIQLNTRLLNALKHHISQSYESDLSHTCTRMFRCFLGFLTLVWSSSRHWFCFIVWSFEMRWWAVFLHQIVSTVSQDSVVICQDVNSVTSGTSINIVNSVNSVKGVNSVNIASSSECIYFVNFWWQLAPWWQQLNNCTAVWQGGQRKKIILMLRKG